jgi:hypothetical protein
MNKDEIVLKFMLALVSNPNIHAASDVRFDRYMEHYADIAFEAERLADKFLEVTAEL